MRYALIAACLIAGPAGAQGLVDSAPSTDRAMAAGPYREMAGCAVKQNRRGAEAVLREASGSPQEKRRIDKLFHDYGCKEMTYYPDASRAEKLIAIANRRAFVAEALLRKRHPDFASRPAPAQAAAPQPVSARAGDNAGMMRDIAACVTAKNWAGAAAVLQAPYASPEEAARLGDLNPTLRECVAPGFGMRLHGLYLRGALAEAVYGALNGGAQTALR